MNNEMNDDFSPTPQALVPYSTHNSPPLIVLQSRAPSEEDGDEFNGQVVLYHPSQHAIEVLPTRYCALCGQKIHSPQSPNGSSWGANPVYISRDYFQLLEGDETSQYSAYTPPLPDSTQEHSLDDHGPQGRSADNRCRALSRSHVQEINEEEAEELLAKEKRPKCDTPSTEGNNQSGVVGYSSSHAAIVEENSSDPGEQNYSRNIHSQSSSDHDAEEEAFINTSLNTSEKEREKQRLLKEKFFNQGYYFSFFKEIRRLGRGGFSSVFLCQHELNTVNLGTFAVKKVPVGENIPWLLARLKEVRMLQELHHPNIVGYHHSWLERAKMADFGPEVPVLYILMEYCDGGSLDSHYKLSCPDFVALPTLEIWEVLHDIAGGLNYLHMCGIIHRDIKPQNLLIKWFTANRERRRKVLLSDFGVSENFSAHTHRTLERTGCTGTLEYMAPECLAVDQPYDQTSDVYSVGIVLYALIFGHTPYTLNGDEDVALLLNGHFLPSTQDLPYHTPEGEPVSTEMRDCIIRCLDFDAKKRPTAFELLRLARAHVEAQLHPLPTTTSRPHTHRLSQHALTHTRLPAGVLKPSSPPAVSSHYMPKYPLLPPSTESHSPPDSDSHSEASHVRPLILSPSLESLPRSPSRPRILVHGQHSLPTDPSMSSVPDASPLPPRRAFFSTGDDEGEGEGLIMVGKKSPSGAEHSSNGDANTIGEARRRPHPGHSEGEGVVETVTKKGRKRPQAAEARNPATTRLTPAGGLTHSIPTPTRTSVEAATSSAPLSFHASGVYRNSLLSVFLILQVVLFQLMFPVTTLLRGGVLIALLTGPLALLSLPPHASVRAAFSSLTDPVLLLCYVGVLHALVVYLLLSDPLSSATLFFHFPPFLAPFVFTLWGLLCFLLLY